MIQNSIKSNDSRYRADLHADNSNFCYSILIVYFMNEVRRLIYNRLNTEYRISDIQYPIGEFIF